jgi:hypothetical protein
MRSLRFHRLMQAFAAAVFIASQSGCCNDVACCKKNQFCCEELCSSTCPSNFQDCVDNCTQGIDSCGPIIRTSKAPRPAGGVTPRKVLVP